jgi:hypothetical protein
MLIEVPMRCLPILLAALAAGTSANAAAQMPPPPSPVVVPPELASGAIWDRLDAMIGPLTKAFLNLPVGELEAAAENRPVRPEDRRKTLRDVTRADGQDVEQEIAQSKGAMKAGSQAIVRALPSVIGALDQAARQIENSLPRN